MSEQAVTKTAPDVEVLVIGAGLAGLWAGIELAKAGIAFTILEKTGEVGGTWKVNRYPGVAVDVNWFSYSYGKVPYFEWSRAFAPGAEVAAYAEHLADTFELRRHIRFHTEVREARFDERAHLWRLALADGTSITGRHLIHAPGGLTQPKRPAIEGLADFEGVVMHTAEWDTRCDLRGKRVAVIGTGASAVQVVPSIAPDVAHLSVFQRTPIWVAPKLDFAITPRMQRIYRHVPGALDVTRVLTALPSTVFFRVGTIHARRVPFLQRGAERYAKWHLARQVHDPALRERLTPKYGFGCKRPVVSNDFLATFNRDNVALVTDGIEKIGPRGIVTKGGRLHEVDVIVLATGFKVFELGNAPPYPVYGSGGLELGRFWHEHRYQAYEACTVPQWPNMFMLTGPYGLGGASYLSMVEAAVRHAVRVITAARRRNVTYAAVRQEAHDQYFADILRRQKYSVFQNGTCAGSNSYYFDHHGDAPAMRPHLGFEIAWHSRYSPLDHYEWKTVAEEPVAIAPHTPPRRRAAVDPSEGTSWLLLRGLGREQRHWGGFPAQLAEASGGRVLCLDLPGFGTEHARRSPSSIPRIMADVRARFMNERGGERWSVLGISLGGMVALDWCARHPDDFARCVTINTSARPSSPFDRFRPAGLRAVVAAMAADPFTRERAVLRVTSNRDAASLDAIAREHAKWALECPPSRESRASQLRAGMTFALPDDVRTPVLVLASAADRLVLHRCSERIAAHLGAPLQTHQLGGHDLTLDDPRWVCTAIANGDRARPGGERVDCRHSVNVPVAEVSAMS